MNFQMLPSKIIASQEKNAQGNEKRKESAG